MPLVSAWYCTHTDKLFSSKKEYVSHLKKLANERMIKVKVEKSKNIKLSQLAEMHDLESFHDIEDWIVKHSDLFVLTSCKLPSGQEIPKIVSIELTNMKFDKFISNSHNAPIGKLTNWGGREGIPTGYPGWKGRVLYRILGSYPEFLSNLFKNTGICLGTGTGSACSGSRVFDNNKLIQSSYSAEVILFAADWPGLSRQQVLTRLLTE